MKKTIPIKAVIDTQVFFRAAINRRSLPAKILFDLHQNYQLVVSQAIFNEIQNVLQRPKLKLKFPSLTARVINEVIELLANAEMVNPETIEAISRDPKDDKFIACALAGKVDYIVSEDKDLLVLHPYQDLQIVNVLEFLRKIEQE